MEETILERSDFLTLNTTAVITNVYEQAVLCGIPVSGIL